MADQTPTWSTSGGNAGADDTISASLGAQERSATNPEPKKRKTGKTEGEHGVRTTRYYSLSNDDLATLGLAQGIATICFSLATGCFFAFLSTSRAADLRGFYMWAWIVLGVFGVALFVYRGTRLRSIRREHDFAEDKLTLLTRLGRYIRSYGD